MPTRKDNIKALFTDTRSRVIVVFTIFLLLLTIIIGYYKFRSPTLSSNAGASLTQAPGGIRSIPGSANPTAQYAFLQEKQNVEQAQLAAKTGKSAIPTLVRSQTFGDGVEAVGPKHGTGALGFTALTRENENGPQQSLWLQQLKDSHCSEAVVKKVMAQGAGLADLKEACSCKQLKENGYHLIELKTVCSCPDLKDAGYTAIQLKAEGYSAQRLKQCGFNACDLEAAGFTTGGEGAPPVILPPGISEADVRKAGCTPDALKRLRQQGVSAMAIRQINGCSATQLKAAGFTAAELKKAGFTAGELKNAGFTAAQLKAAGFTADELKNAGFTAGQLKAAGFTPGELDKAGFTPAELEAAGFTPGELKNAGIPLPISKRAVANCSPAALKAAYASHISAASIRDTLGCSASALKAAGYSAADLKAAGFTAGELKNAGFTASQLKNAGFSADALRAAGFTASQLKAAGFTAAELKNAGFTASELKNAGFSAEQLKNAGFSAKDLKDAGFTASQLKAAGFTAGELKNAGFTASELKNAGFSAEQLKDAGFSAKALKDAGFTAGELSAAGFSAKALKQAGYSAADLARSGFNAAQLKDAGYTDAELQAAGALAGLNPLTQGVVVPLGEPNTRQAQELANNRRLDAIIAQQKERTNSQQYQQKIQQRTSTMASAASQFVQGWKTTFTQTLVTGNAEEKLKTQAEHVVTTTTSTEEQVSVVHSTRAHKLGGPAIHAGEVLFAVLDTSVDSDQPGPILATVVAGRYKGGKLIGSFNLPANDDKMVISFNMLSMPGAAHTTSISAYAIDPNTARTALSSESNHHYLMRYGSLFAATFLEGFGNAFQSQNTTITIGGTGGVSNTTVSTGASRSLLENAVIGLATVGKSWGDLARQNVNIPTTVKVCSGTGIGVLFTQDIEDVGV